MSSELATETFAGPTSGSLIFVGSTSGVVQPDVTSGFAQGLGFESGDYTFTVSGKDYNLQVTYAVSASDSGGNDFFVNLTGTGGSSKKYFNNASGSLWYLLTPGTYTLGFGDSASADAAFQFGPGSQSTHANGAFGFNLSAVPEPATWAMMLLGLFGLGATVRRSRRRQVGATAPA
jgi:hypothetical protein